MPVLRVIPRGGPAFGTAVTQPDRFPLAVSQGPDLRPLQQALGQITSAGESFLRQQGDIRVRTESVEAFNAASELWRGALRNDVDGFLERDAKAAVEDENGEGVTQAGLRRYQEIGTEVAGELRGEARAQFLATWQSRTSREAEMLNRHETREREVWEQAVRVSTNNRATDEILARGADDASISEAMFTADATAAAMLGVSPEDPVARDNARAIKTRAIDTAIETVLSGPNPNPERASQILTDAVDRGNVDPDKVDELRGKIGTTSTVVASQDATDEIVIANPLGSVGEWTATARDSLEGQLRDDTVARLEARSATRTRSQAFEQNQTLESTYTDAKEYIDSAAFDIASGIENETMKDGFMSRLQDDQTGRQAFEKWWDAQGQVATKWDVYTAAIAVQPGFWNTHSAHAFRKDLADPEFKDLVRHVAKATENAPLLQRANARMDALGIRAADAEGRGKYLTRMWALRDVIPDESELFESLDKEFEELESSFIFFSIDSPPFRSLSDDDVLERTDNATKALAVDQASNGGVNTVSRESVIAQINLILRENQKQKISRTKESYKKYVDEQTEAAADALIRIRENTVGLEFFPGEGR